MCERERYVRFKRRCREVEADFELGKPPMFKSKVTAAGPSGP